LLEEYANYKNEVIEALLEIVAIKLTNIIKRYLGLNQTLEG